MKLRNKKTGEIGNLITICASTRVFVDKKSDKVYNTLAELNEEWEDYEEPETYYYISDCANIESLTNDHGYNLPEEIWHKAIERRKEFGNYFETREEAEKALEKLKAWKRLKDKGFRFVGRSIRDLTITYSFDNYDEPDIPQMNEDLDLLFGGKE